MGKKLLLYLCYALIPALVTSDFLIEQFRNIKKRSTSDAHPGGIEVYWLKIDCKVTSRFAHNVITSRAVNRANVSKEAVFDVDLPKTAFITNFTMTIDGVSYPGVIKEKEAAQQQYQKAVSRGQSAGLVKASGRKTEKFTVKVNIAAASKVNFELTYEELFKRTFGKYELYLKINSKEIINKFEIEANIYEPQGISFLDVEGTFLNNDLLPLVKKSFSGKKGHVLFSPTIDQQRSCENCTTSLLQGDFIIKYDVNRDSPSKMQIVNGYFVHFFAPKNLQHLPKNIAFVIDISGSMSGQKIKQTKEALTRIVEDLKEEDHFNFILFHSTVSTWKDKLIKATPENVEEAKDFISKIIDRGATNLNGGLMTGIEMLNEAHASGYVPARSASLVIMLTDGQANEGETREDVIQENIKNATQGRYPLYNLGFGYDVDYGFLERLAKQNNGLARRIYEDSDADLQLQGFYDEVANPLLTDVALQYPENAVSDLTQNNFKHYYDGSEIVVAGRIADNDLKRMTAAVNAQGAENEVTFSDEADIDEEDPPLDAQLYIFDEYVERLWAYLTVNQLLEERNTRTGYEKSNLTAKALDMALKYKFVTPLTSMVVTKPEDIENANETDIADKPIEAEAKRGFSYQAPPSYPYYSSVDSDPHFIIAVPEKEDALCFNINEEPGIVLNLVRDPITGIIINGKLIGDKTSSNDAGPQNTYFGTIGIVNSPLDLRIEITTEEIILQNGRKQNSFKWLDNVIFRQRGFTLIIKPKKSVEVSVDDGARFLVILHQVWKKHPLHRDFLGFYTLDSHRLSEQTHGLLGQFYHSIDFSILEVHPGIDPEKPDATMIVKNNQLTVTRGWQKDYRNDARHGVNIPCWFIHNNGEGLIDGVHTDYIVPRIF